MEAEAYAVEAAEKVKEIRGEADDFLNHIRLATDIESQQLEDLRLQLQQQHAEKLKELQSQIREVRESTDEGVEKIEVEMQREQARIEEELLKKSEERREALKSIKEEVEDFSALADDQYQKSLETERELHEGARKAMLDMDNERWRKVEDMEQSCQMWITAFNQRRGQSAMMEDMEGVEMLEQTQADLAYRVEHLVGEARAARLRLHEARAQLDRQWEEEVDRQRRDALKERFDAASTLDQARLRRRELEGISREKSLQAIEDCKLMKGQHLSTLRRIAEELDQMRRNIGLQARDPLLVQSIKELASKIRQGQMKQQPPRLKGQV